MDQQIGTEQWDIRENPRSCVSRPRRRPPPGCRRRGPEQAGVAWRGALQIAMFNRVNFSSIANDANGVIQIVNVGAERMLGYTAAQVMNQATRRSAAPTVERDLDRNLHGTLIRLQPHARRIRRHMDPHCASADFTAAVAATRASAPAPAPRQAARARSARSDTIRRSWRAHECARARL